MFTGRLASRFGFQKSFFLRRFTQHCGKRLLALSCLSVCVEQFGSQWTDSYEIWYSRIFSRKSAEKIKLYYNTAKKTGTLGGEYVNLWLFRWNLREMRKNSEKCLTENQNTFYVEYFFRKSCLLWDNVEKHRMQCCLPIATLATRTRRNVKLYVHCLACLCTPLWYPVQRGPTMYQLVNVLIPKQV
jgi:hypothetical protein